ncbi:MAG: FG-GAP-like repeat-containing protein, partial [Leptospiraceae bacterium]|nr:FG-GAP-like repeat-containing protein [Leptospiraceae bacterium]
MKLLLNHSLSISLRSKVQFFGLISLVFASIFTFGFILSGEKLPMALPGYQVDSNGNLTISIPLDIPSGTNELQPELSFQYHSQMGNGYIGKGWYLTGISSIRREGANSSIIPESYTHSESGDLVYHSGSSGYRSRNESFQVWKPSDSSSNPNSWIEEGSDGSLRIYGQSGDSVILGNDSSIWEWFLSEERDSHNNAISYEYTNLAGNLYPSKIIYSNGNRTIDFIYSEKTDIGLSSLPRNYKNRRESANAHLLTEIQFSSMGELTHSYRLSYNFNSKTKEYGLDKLEYRGDSLFQTHEPLVFSLSPNSNNLLDSNSVSTKSDGYGGSIDLVDKMFELLKEALFSAYASSQFKSHQTAKVPKYQRGFNKTFGKALGIKTQSYDSGGASEIPSEYLYTETELLGQYPLPNSARNMCFVGEIACLCSLFPTCPFVAREHCGRYVFFGGLDACNNGIKSPSPVTIPTDFDGDGISEYTRILGRMQEDSVLIKSVNYANGNSDSVLGSFKFKYNTYFDTGDLDGDGRTDIVFERNGKLNVLYSNGGSLSAYGFDHVNINPALQNYRLYAPYTPENYIVDWNGDGRDDFIHVTNGSLEVYFSTGRSFTEKTVYSLAGRHSILHLTKDKDPFKMHRVNQFIDWNGDGQMDHVMIRRTDNVTASDAITNLRATHEAQLNDRKGEFNGIENEIRYTLNNPGAVDSGRKDYLKNLLSPDDGDRDLFQRIVDGSESNTSEKSERLVASFNKHTIAPRVGDLLQDQKNQMDQLIDSLKNQTYSPGSYELVVTLFHPSNGSVSQYAIGLESVGAVGFNWLMDVNSDGLPDLVSLQNGDSHKNPYIEASTDPNTLTSTFKTKINTGVGLTGEVHTGIAHKISPKIGFQIADINEDGYIDILLPDHGASQLVAYLGNGLGNFFNSDRAISLETFEVNSIRMEDRNKDGKPDLFYQYNRNSVTKEKLSQSSLPWGQITKVSDGKGGEVGVNYRLKKDFPQAYIEANRSYDNGIPNPSAQWLVEKISTRAHPTTPLVEVAYDYRNQRFKPGDDATSANLGFETQIQKVSINGNLESESTIVLSQNPKFAGMPVHQETRTATGQLIQQSITSYQQVNPTSVTRLNLPLNATSYAFENGSLKDTKTQAYTYDPNYLYSPTTITETWNGRTTVKQTVYTNQGSFKALPIEETVTIDGTLVAHTKLTFVGSDVASESKLVSPGKWYVQNFTYDSLGNVITQTDNLGRSLSYSYGGTTGSQPIEATNALGQKTKTEYDPKTDEVIRTIDANNQFLENKYDVYGRKTKTSLNGTKVESYQYEFTGSQYITTKTLHTYEGDTWTKQISDKEGKTLRSEALVTTGITQTEETIYDAKGRAIQKSHSYLTGETPTWTITEYYTSSEDSNQRPKRVTANTGEITNLVYTPTTTTITTTNEGETIRTETLTTDAYGQLITKTVQGESIQYEYNKQGKLTKIFDPANGTTSMSYDIGGRKISQTDQNSGTTTYTYNVAGEMLTQTDARGLTQTFTTDNLGRITKIQPSNSEPAIEYIYDQGNQLSSNNTIGKLTKVLDSTGYTEYAYDERGNNIAERKIIDDLTVNFSRSYDALGRMKKMKYPEGTEIEYMYTNTGQITSILMHSHDGSYRNQPVVQYIGPVQEDNKLIVKRKTGNNVVMDIEYDPLRRRPKSLKTTLAEGQTEQNVAYTYDKKGNISSITDRLNESRSQTFEYDSLNRVTKAIGKYGTEEYNYHKNGNLLQRGQFALQYTNPNHIHAVTKVSSLQTGDTNYTYDTTGNLIERNGDVFRYNSQNKLTEITTAGGDVFQYSYDASGNRIKKQLKNANTTTYNFNNLYEIHRSPGEPEKHTMYIPGIEGDKVAQYTRSDALLVQANINENRYASIFQDNPDQNSIFDQRRNYLETKETVVSLFQEIESDIALVLFNIPKPKLLTDNYQMLPSMRVLIWLLSFGVLVYYTLTLNTHEAFATRRLRLATSFALFPFFFATSAGCSPLFFGGAQGEEGTPPWLLLAAVPGDTPSVSDEPTFFGGGSGSGATTTNSARITGMYFY